MFEFNYIDWFKIKLALLYYRWFGEVETEDDFKVLEIESSPDIVFDYDRFSK